jgi:DNA-binding NarL/FixJ family response regulator
MTSILIVDDGGADREAVATILGSAGYTVLRAVSGERALRLAQTQQPTLIIADTDILMATMDGYDLVRELRVDTATAEIPVVLYPATYALDEVRRLAAACGVFHILVKPSAPEEVIRVVGEAIAQRPDRPVAALPSEDFHREHLRVLNAKLLQKVEELRETVILVGALQRESLAGGESHRWPMLAPDPRLEALSPRELEVLNMIVDGATNSEIARRLVIATSTVQSHVKRILHKLGVKNRTEAAVRFVRR